MTTPVEDAHPDGEALPSPTLSLFGKGRVGILHIPLTSSLWIDVRLIPSLSKVILVLSDRLDRDAELPPGLRGWMNNTEIAQSIGDAGEYAYMPSEETIASYKSRIQRLIRRATPPGHEPPRLFEAQRLVGIRLLRQIDVIDLSQRLRRSTFLDTEPGYGEQAQ